MRLKELREQHNISQSELAKILKVSSAAISNWEKGKRQPDLNMIITMADYFGVSVDQVIGRKAYERPRELTKREHTANQDRIAELYEKLKVLDEEYIPAIDSIVDGLINKKSNQWLDFFY